MWLKKKKEEKKLLVGGVYSLQEHDHRPLILANRNDGITFLGRTMDHSSAHSAGSNILPKSHSAKTDHRHIDSAKNGCFHGMFEDTFSYIGDLRRVFRTKDRSKNSLMDYLFRNSAAPSAGALCDAFIDNGLGHIIDQWGFESLTPTQRKEAIECQQYGLSINEIAKKLKLSSKQLGWLLHLSDTKKKPYFKEAIDLEL